MRAGPAFLKFDWSKTGLRKFPYEGQLIQIFFVRQGRYIVQHFMWLQIFYFKPRRENLAGLLFCLDCQGLLITEIVICIHYLIVSSPQAVRPTILSFHLSANMYVFNVKSYTESECPKQ